jgi:predicted short-subunit dehydrogenase-like oxidoreductase (DUF2520 family)
LREGSFVVDRASTAAGSRPTRVVIVGRGRVGGALAANLRGNPAFDVAEPIGRGVGLAGLAAEADMVLLAVTDAAVGEVAAAIDPTPDALFVHFAGSLTLEALHPHARRASLHPLTPMPGDPETAVRRLRGAWMAIAGDQGVELLAGALEARTFRVDEAQRARYHATATIAASHLSGLLGQVARNAAEVDVPLAAFLALSQSTLDNVSTLGPAAALTGPIVRADWTTLRSHLAAIAVDDRDAYLALAAEAARLADVELPDDLATVRPG